MPEGFFLDKGARRPYAGPAENTRKLMLLEVTDQ
jgi:hypothetical protein